MSNSCICILCTQLTWQKLVRWQENREREVEKRKNHHAIELQMVCPDHKTPKFKKSPWCRKAMEEERKLRACCVNGRKQFFSLKSRWRLSLWGIWLMILFHEPAHFKHISLEKWHRHFISCSRSLEYSKNKFEAEAKGRKQKSSFGNKMVMWTGALCHAPAPVGAASATLSSPNDSAYLQWSHTRGKKDDRGNAQ